MAAPPQLWQEALLASPGSCVPAAAPPAPPAPSRFSFSLQSVGGAVVLDADAGAGVAWQIENGSAGSLQLAEFCMGASPPAPPLALDFGCQLFPGVACVQGGQGGAGSCTLVGLTAHGHAYHADLRALLHAPSPAAAAALIAYTDLSAHWPSVGAPTCIAACGGHVVVGGAAGPLLCVPAAWLLRPPHATALDAPGLPFELRESSWGLRSLMAGVLGGARSPSAVAVAPLPDTPAALPACSTVLVTYDDCSVRTFSLGRRQQLHAEALDPDGPAAAKHAPVFAHLHLHPPTGAPSSSAAATSGLLVVQLEAKDTLAQRLVAYGVSFSAGGARLAIKHRTDLQPAPASATAVAAAVQGDTTWVLLRLPRGGTRLVGYDGAGRMCSAGALAEASMLPSALVKEPGSADAMLMVGWPCGMMGCLSRVSRAHAQRVCHSAGCIVHPPCPAPSRACALPAGPVGGEPGC